MNMEIIPNPLVLEHQRAGRQGTYESQWWYKLGPAAKFIFRRNPGLVVPAREFNKRYFFWEHPEEANPASVIISMWHNHIHDVIFEPNEIAGIVMRKNCRVLNVPNRMTASYLSRAA